MDVGTIITYATPIISTLAVTLVKKIKPNIPTFVLPIICTVGGALVTWLASIALHNPNNILLGAALGLAGVGVREIVDQLKPAPEEPKD